jgi:glutathione S-transferase
MYLLYHFPASQHSRRVVSLLEETSLPCELRLVDMMQGGHLSPEYLAINPNHQVPTLIDGDIRIHESNAILRYLCAKHRLEDWYPSNLHARARVEQWLDWGQCRMSPAVVGIVLNSVFLAPNGDEVAIARGKAVLPELLAILEDGLGHADFLAGSRPTIADLAIASNVFQLSMAGIGLEAPRSVDWYRRINKLEGYRRSLPTS